MRMRRAVPRRTGNRLSGLPAYGWEFRLTEGNRLSGASPYRGEPAQRSFALPRGHPSEGSWHAKPRRREGGKCCCFSSLRLCALASLR